MATEDWGNDTVIDDNMIPIQSGYKWGHIISEIENIFGRQSASYLAKLANDGLMEIGDKMQHAQFSQKRELREDVRWYSLPPQLIDVIRVEILSTPSDASCSLTSYANKTDCEAAGGTWSVPVGRYTMIPKLSNPHTLLKGDES